MTGARFARHGNRHYPTTASVEIKQLTDKDFWL